MLRRLLLLPLPLLFACTTSTSPGWGDPAFEEEAHEAVEGYVHLVIKSYAATIEAAEAMDVAVDAFLAAPSDATLEAARQAWLTARDIYGQTEVYRFYGGPIDAEPDGLEGRINSWPMDEAYVDYVDGMPDVGIINNPTDYPDITRELLIDLNGAGGEDDISTGWHAIEFLLWGQDLRDDGAGQRPFTDYVDGGTAANPGRRADYLAIVTDLLVEDLKAVAAAWDEGAAYHEEFEHDLGPHKALENVLLGMGSLAGAELSGERMGVAYDTREQEDEHSCFSDNTHNDLRTNALGLQNAYLSRWGGAEETSVSTLVAALDPALDQAMRERLQAAVDAIDAIPPPFDSAIKAPDGSPERQSVADAIAALKELTATIVEVATLLDISLNLEE